MMNFLDLLVVSFMALLAVGLLAICLMFLTKKPVVQKASLYVAAALALYTAAMGAYIGSTAMFASQAALGVAAGVAAIAAVVLERVSKGDEKKFLAARIVAAAALVIGTLNAFM